LTAAGRRPEDVTAVYLTGAGEPEQDRCELELVTAALGTARPPLTALTPLAGSHGGLGALRVAAAAVATLGAGVLPGLPDLAEPLCPDAPLRVGPAAPVGAGSVLVHALGPGGTHVALILEPAA
jgi:3-oxoacyl-(acyl-carrier-protein) synthase